MSVFGSGIHLRASHLYLGDLWVGCEDRGIWNTGSSRTLEQCQQLWNMSIVPTTIRILIPSRVV